MGLDLEKERMKGWKKLTETEGSCEASGRTGMPTQKGNRKNKEYESNPPKMESVSFWMKLI